MVVRKIEIEDFPVIHKFICELEGTDLDYSDLLDIFKVNILSNDNEYLLAEEAGIIMGFITCHSQLLLHHGLRVAEIQEFFVSKDFRMKGIGKLLLETLKNHLMLKNIGLLEVTAQNRRTETHSFYEGNGFVQSHKKFVQNILEG